MATSIIKDNLLRKIGVYNYANSSGSFLDWIRTTFTENGLYYVVIATTNGTGRPASSTGVAIIMKRNADWYVIEIDGSTMLAIFINQFTGNTWKGWVRIAGTPI